MVHLPDQTSHGPKLKLMAFERKKENGWVASKRRSNLLCFVGCGPSSVRILRSRPRSVSVDALRLGVSSCRFVFDRFVPASVDDS